MSFLIKKIREAVKLAGVKGSGYAIWIASVEARIEYGRKIRSFFKFWTPFLLVLLGMILNMGVIYALFVARDWIEATQFRLFCFGG